MEWPLVVRSSVGMDPVHSELDCSHSKGRLSVDSTSHSMVSCKSLQACAEQRLRIGNYMDLSFKLPEHLDYANHL